MQVGQAVVTSSQTVAADPQPTCYTPQQTPTQTVTQTIGASGGTISVSGIVDLQIPAGALPQDTTFKLKTYADSDPTRLYGVRIEPENLKFNNSSASLVFHYTTAQLAAWGIGDPATTHKLLLVQYRPNPNGGLPDQAELNATVDGAAKTVTALIDQTGVAAIPANTLTVQGLHVQDEEEGVPLSPEDIAALNPSQLDENREIKLKFTPIPLKLKLTTFPPNPTTVNNYENAIFTATVEGIDYTQNVPFDYTEAGLVVQGQLIDPNGAFYSTVAFWLDAAKSNPIKKVLTATAPQLEIEGVWTLSSPRLFLDADPTTVLWTGADQHVTVANALPKITSISPSSGACGDTLTLTGKHFGTLVTYPLANHVLYFDLNVSTTSWSDTQIIFAAPNYYFHRIVGVYIWTNVPNSTPGWVLSNTVNFTNAPCLTSGTADRGYSPGGGDPDVIYINVDGLFFGSTSSNTSVTVDGNSATLYAVDDHLAQIRIPFTNQQHGSQFTVVVTSNGLSSHTQIVTLDNVTGY